MLLFCFVNTTNKLEQNFIYESAKRVFPSFVEENRFQLKLAGVPARAECFYQYQNNSGMHSSQHMYRHGSAPTCGSWVPKVQNLLWPAIEWPSIFNVQHTSTCKGKAVLRLVPRTMYLLRKYRDCRCAWVQPYHLMFLITQTSMVTITSGKMT